MMGLGDVSEKVVPKVILLAKPRHGGTIPSRYFVPHKTHAAHAVTGAICLACCCVLEDGVAAPLVELPAGPPFPTRIEHPSDRKSVVSGKGVAVSVNLGGG